MGQSVRRRGTCRPTVPNDTRKRKDKETNTSYDEPKRHIVLSGKRNIVGVDDKTDMSEDYEKFHEIAPFTVNVDPSIQLNDKDCPFCTRSASSFCRNPLYSLLSFRVI